MVQILIKMHFFISDALKEIFKFVGELKIIILLNLIYTERKRWFLILLSFVTFLEYLENVDHILLKSDERH